MGRVVYHEVDLTLVSDATQDIWSVIATSAMKIKMLGWELSSTAIVATLIKLSFHRITAVGSGGAGGGAEERADEQSGTVLGDVRFEDTTPGADGGQIMSYQWEQLGPVGHIWTPEMAPRSLVSQGFALTMDTAAIATFSGWLCWEEV